MITKDSIETAYSFLHQKRNVYIHSNLEWQKDDIEYAISSFVDEMNPELYNRISKGNPDFLRTHNYLEIPISFVLITTSSAISPQLWNKWKNY